jgi:hypothetical protein
MSGFLLATLVLASTPLLDRSSAETPGSISPAETPGSISSAEMLGQNGAAGQGCVETGISRAEWWYNWYVDPGCNMSGFVAMVSGRDKQSAGDIQWQVDRAYSNGYRTLLGFNEPNEPGQSVMSVKQALDLWPVMTSHPDVRVGSPAVSGGNGGKEWFTAFMQGVEDQKLHVDFVAAHFYGWNEGSCTAANLESYLKWVKSVAKSRPIWVTEFGCLNKSKPDQETVSRFYEGAVHVMRRLGIERWAWYTPEQYHALVDDGRLSGLGQAFAANSAQPVRPHVTPAPCVTSQG